MIESKQQTVTIGYVLIAAFCLSLLSRLWTDDIGYSRKVSVLSVLWLGLCVINVCGLRIRIMEEKVLGNDVHIQGSCRDLLFSVLSIILSCYGARFIALEYWYAYLLAFLLPVVPGVFYLAKRYSVVRRYRKRFR